MFSADHGSLIFEQSFENIIEDADFYNNPVSISTSTFGVFMTDKKVYGVRLNIANETYRNFQVLGSRDFEQKPKIIRAIKQKSNFKAMLYNDVTDEMEIFT